MGMSRKLLAGVALVACAASMSTFADARPGRGGGAAPANGANYGPRNGAGAPFGNQGFYGTTRNPTLRNNGFGYVYGAPGRPGIRPGGTVPRTGFNTGPGGSVQSWGDNGYYGNTRNPTLRNNGFGYVYGAPGQSGPFPDRRRPRGFGYDVGGYGAYGAYGAAAGYAGYPAYGSVDAGSSAAGYSGCSSVQTHTYDDHGRLNSFSSKAC